MRRALVILALAAALVPLVGRAQTITAAPGGSMTSLVGMPFDVPFYVDMTARPEKVGSFAARIQWNPAVLQFDGGSDGTFGAITVNEDSLTAGVARVAGANPAGAGGLVTLGILHFTPLLAQADTLLFSVSQLYAAGTFATLSPVTTRDGYFCPARGMFGDIDKDGAINSRDALIALSNAVGLDVSAYDITLGDVDNNGVTNARDALIILTSAVGLPVTGFQVGRLAGGACSANLPLVMAIVPDTVSLVVGQTVALEARAADSSGALQTVTNVIWKSGNAATLAVAPDGSALAHDTGTVVVTAIRTALDSAQAVVHIVAHRTREIVDAAATGAKNQLGSAEFPFAQINQGIAFAQAGDTVEVRVGHYDETAQLDRAAVLVGDTLPDGTRPLITIGPDSGFAGIALTGTGTRMVRNLAIDGFQAGVDVEGPSAVVLHGLRVTDVWYGAGSETPFGSLRLESSRLTGFGVNNGSYESSDGLYFDSPLDTLVVQDAEISDFSGDGVYGPGIDSLAVLRSRIHDVGSYGIVSGPNAGECEGECCDDDCAAPRRAAAGASVVRGPSVGFAMDSSVVLSADDAGIYLDGIRSAAFSHSVLNNSGYAIEVYGLPGGWVSFRGDSIVQPESESDWLEAEELDSLTMDSVFAQSYDGEGYVYTVPMVRVTNSQFTGYYGTALYVGGPSGYGVVALDNVIVTGDPSCDACMEGFSFGGERVTANRLSLTNLDEALYAYGTDSSMTVTNSAFHHVYYGIEWYGSDADSSVLTVKNSTFLGFYDAVYVESGGLQVDTSAFMNGTEDGIYFDAGGRLRVLQSTFASIYDAMDLYPYYANRSWVDTIAGNTITGVSDEGIYAEDDDTTHLQILGNSVSCGGGSYAYGIDFEYASGAVAGNRVSGCGYGVYVYDDGGPALREDSVVGNTIQWPGNTEAGIYVEGSIRSRIADNVVTADTASSSYYGGIYVYGYTSDSTTAVIDSNTVTGGSSNGIYLEWLDSALVRWNAVRGVNGNGVVANSYFSYLARIYGNSVRGVTGDGMDLDNGDSAMIHVDSNLVDSAAGNGLYLEGGADSVVHNWITASGSTGVNVGYVDSVRTVVDSNNIAGNRYGLYLTPSWQVKAQYDWWGDAGGPSYTGSGALGDSVSALGVNFVPVATAPYGNTPSPAVPARAMVALRSGAGARAIAAPARRGLDAPLAKRAQATRVARPGLVTAARPSQQGAAAATVVPRAIGARAPAWARRARQQTGVTKRVTGHSAAMAAVNAAVSTAHASLMQRAEQRQAQHEARLNAKLARQAAARAGVPRAHRVVQ